MTRDRVPESGLEADRDRVRGSRRLLGAAAGLGLSALFVAVFGQFRIPPQPAGTAERIGASIFDDWVLPFEVLSVLLLAALVGAIVVSRPSPKDAAEQGSGR